MTEQKNQRRIRRGRDTISTLLPIQHGRQSQSNRCRASPKWLSEALGQLFENGNAITRNQSYSIVHSINTCRELKKLRCLLNELSGLYIDTPHIPTVIIKWLLKWGYKNEAYILFRKAKEVGVVNEITFGTILNGALKYGDWDYMQNLFRKLEKKMYSL